jgi:type IV secretion system protein VirB10
MLHAARLLRFALISATALTLVHAADSDRDFSGKWLFVADHSEMRDLPGDPYPVLVVEQKSSIHCTATDAQGVSVQWTYRLDGENTKYRIGAESMDSEVKWEGAALLINTLVSGPRDYTFMDRWTLSRDGAQLNVQRQIVQGPRQMEGYLIYRREGAPGASPASPTAAMVQPPSSAAGQPVLIRRPEPPATPPAEYKIAAGTHILLILTNPVSTKNSKDGDRVYLQTAVPVAQNGRIVIPRGSDVQGSVNKSKAAGRGNNKGELYIRFDSLTLPNGVSRDFHARLTSADTAKGAVDPDEGKVSGTGRNTDSGTVVRDVGIGSMGGVLVGSAAGHPITGLGVGAAAGLAAVLLSKNQDVVLPRGASVEMVLDRDLYYTSTDLQH